MLLILFVVLWLISLYDIALFVTCIFDAVELLNSYRCTRNLSYMLHDPFLHTTPLCYARIVIATANKYRKVT
ncbi:MAG: hypothetical protein BWX92_03010 [Deltaproteobacteria bacterium ADurb.Bin135]|nr:MAG: hypothetical protein BWX92_03010 [Deltaproteobacteria bacterium ADurb.Bin135]